MDIKIDVKETSLCERKISVEIPVSLIEEEMQRYFSSLSREVRLKGFREGKAPMEIIKVQFQGEVSRKTISHLIEKTYEKVLMDYKLFPVTQPKIKADTWKEGTPFQYTAIVEVKPELEVKDYQGIPLQKEKIKIDPKKIQDSLEELRQSKSQLKLIASPRAAQEKDFVVIDFEGTVDGKSFPGGSAKNLLYEIGSHQFVPDFEEGLKNMKPSEEKEINVQFPSDFHEKKLADKKTLFKVKLLEIKEKETPALDDALAKQFDGCQTLHDLKEKVKKDLTTYEERRIQKLAEENALKYVVEKNKFTPPSSMVTRQYDFLMDDSKKRLEHMGAPKEKLEEELQKWAQNLKEKAQFDVCVALLLEAIAKKEKLEINEKELDEALEKLAKQSGGTLTQIKAYYKDKGYLSQIRWQLLQEKIIGILISKAKIKEID